MTYVAFGLFHKGNPGIDVYLHRLKLKRDDVELIGPLKGMGGAHPTSVYSGRL